MSRCQIFLLISLATISCLLGQTQSKSLEVARQGDRFVVSAPQMHFISGRQLEQLRDGASVTFVFSVTLSGSGSPMHVRQRFVVSYDLWEEKFSIIQADGVSRSASHLSAVGAERWCFENLSVPLPNLKPDKSFSIKLECSVEEPESPEPESGLTLGKLIDVFSRNKPEQLPRWEAVSGSLHLSDFKEKGDRTPPKTKTVPGYSVPA